jgi:putative SOS response-associated peptidase YedK
VCGRITLTSKPSRLPGIDGTLHFEFWPGTRFNIAPTESVATILSDGTPTVRETMWGLVPSCAKEVSTGNLMFNARSETVTTKPAFKKPFRGQRCVILADGFYEWKTIPGQRQRQPMYIRLKSHEVFGLAGLWDAWQQGDGTQLLSSAVITTTPNELMATVHNRMPVILTAQVLPTWPSVNAVPYGDLLACLQPYPDVEMEMHPVLTRVNRSGNNDPGCVLRVEAGAGR